MKILKLVIEFYQSRTNSNIDNVNLDKIKNDFMKTLDYYKKNNITFLYI